MKKEKNVIFVFAGWMVRKNGKWRTDDIDEVLEPVSGLGSRLRVLAAFQLAKAQQDHLIVLSGAKGHFAKIVDAPTASEVMKRELIELGIPEGRIIKQEKAGSTFEELVALKEMITQKQFGKVVAISSKYHLPRIKAFIEHHNALATLLKMWKDGRLLLKSAEDLLQGYDAGWKRKIEKAYQKDQMKDIIRQERKGVRQIIKGNYKYAKFDD